MRWWGSWRVEALLFEKHLEVAQSILLGVAQMAEMAIRVADVMATNTDGGFDLLHWFERCACHCATGVRLGLGLSRGALCGGFLDGGGGPKTEAREERKRS